MTAPEKAREGVRVSTMQELFVRLVSINSESGHEERVLEELGQILTDELEARCESDAYGNLIARLPARDSNKKTPVLLAAHADTVRPGTGIVPIIADGVVHSQGDTVLGADDKAGIVEIIEALRTAERHPPVEVLVTRCEEIGLLGAKNLDVSLLDSRMGFVLDTSDLNAILVGGPTHVSINVEIQGKAAHAGLRPEQGISAIRAAAQAILSIQEGRIDGDTTTNVGIIQGGDARNSVPGKATVQAECRSLVHEKALQQKTAIEDAFRRAGRGMGAEVQVESEIEYEATMIAADRPVVEAAREAVRRAGLEPDVRVSAGGSDAIILTARGIESVVLGYGGKQAHSLEEHIALADMERAAAILRHLLSVLS